ncbi:hypothetical protein JCM6882_007228 [Rhodosporidiobolus microsporus]
MANASSNLFYGVFVKTVRLCVVGRAWTAIEPVFRAVDLIELRRSGGTLRFEGGTGEVNVGALPNELWISIKQHVAQNELVDAEDDLVRDFSLEFDNSYNIVGDEERAIHAQKLELSHFHDCDHCWQEFADGGGLRELLHCSKASIGRLLGRHGLELLGTTLSSAEEWASFDLESLSPIALQQLTPTSPPPGPAAPSSLKMGQSSVELNYDMYTEVHPSPSAPPTSSEQAGRAANVDDAAPAWHLWGEGFVDY